MHHVFQISRAVKIKQGLDDGFERDILHYPGARRYLATWWSEDQQCPVWADGETWAVVVEEDEWVWWTYTLMLDTRLEVHCLGFDLNRPLQVLILDRQRKELWLVPVGDAFDILQTQVQRLEPAVGPMGI